MPTLRLSKEANTHPYHECVLVTCTKRLGTLSTQPSRSSRAGCVGGASASAATDLGSARSETLPTRETSAERNLRASSRAGGAGKHSRGPAVNMASGISPPSGARQENAGAAAATLTATLDPAAARTTTPVPVPYGMRPYAPAERRSIQAHLERCVIPTFSIFCLPCREFANSNYSQPS